MPKTPWRSARAINQTHPYRTFRTQAKSPPRQDCGSLSGNTYCEGRAQRGKKNTDLAILSLKRVERTLTVTYRSIGN